MSASKSTSVETEREESVALQATTKISTKHSQVAKTIREEVEAGIWPAGSRIPSEQEIAKRFGVAYMTARQAVSSLVQDRVLERIARKGTFVTQDDLLRRAEERTGFILLLEGGKTSLDPYYLPPIIEAMERELNTSGFDLLTRDYSVSIREGLLPKEAVICCILLSEPELLYASLLQERGNKILAINRCDEHPNIPFLAPDNEEGSKIAVEHLIHLGHQRIGFIRGLPGNIDAEDRRRGYIKTLKKHGISIGPEDGDDFKEECGYDVAKRMLSEVDAPTAIFCASDLSAIGAMKAIAEAGLSVPDDISIVGFGDFPLARFWHPGLTTLHLPLAQLGVLAAREMLKLANGKKIGSQFLSCELIKRNTTAGVRIFL